MHQRTVPIAPLAALIPLAFAVVACEPPAPDLIAVMEAEDRRAASTEDLALLRTAATDPDPDVRRVAVRALGRLELPDLVADIAPATEDDDAGVRAAAVWSLAQTTSGGGQDTVIAPLHLALARDPDPTVRAAAAVSMGRLAYAADAIDDAEQVLVRASFTDRAAHSAESPSADREPRHDADPEILLGVARGLEALTRLHRSHELSPDTIARLTTLSQWSSEAPEATRIRALALISLTRRSRVDVPGLAAALRDDSPEVRRIATGAIAALPPGPERAALLDRAAGDVSHRVRYAALTPAPEHEPGACHRIHEALDDPSTHVRLRAIDQLALCPGSGKALAALTASLPNSNASNWHEPAHALVGLARIDPERAAATVTAVLDHPVWQVRAYAARAAATSGDATALESFAIDPHANVRTLALRGLQATEGHEADDLYIAALASDDYELLITAADALTATPAPDAALAELLITLERISRQERETSRDARRALLDRVAELGGDAQADDLAPYLTDFDPEIAALAAQTIAAWTGQAPQMDVQPLPLLTFPTFDELTEMAGARVTVTMVDGSSFRLALRPFEAPSNTARFVRLAREGYFDGLTFHRVVPNFVIQGGSPGANE